MGSSTVMLYLSNSTTNPGQPWLPNNLQMVLCSTEDHLEVTQLPQAAQGLLRNLTIIALLKMIPCCLPHSCTKHPITLESYIQNIYLLGKKCIPMFSQLAFQEADQLAIQLDIQIDNQLDCQLVRQIDRQIPRQLTRQIASQLAHQIARYLASQIPSQIPSSLASYLA